VCEWNCSEPGGAVTAFLMSFGLSDAPVSLLLSCRSLWWVVVSRSRGGVTIIIGLPGCGVTSSSSSVIINDCRPASTSAIVVVIYKLVGMPERNGCLSFARLLIAMA
jgi:hypothetical protein